MCALVTGVQTCALPISCIWSSRSTSTTTPRGVGSTTAPEKPMPRIWIDAAAVLLAATLLGGCATSKEKLLPHGDNTMLDIWHQETGGSAGGGQAARQLQIGRAHV